MSTWYVYSGAVGTASGADWANAKTTIAAAISAGAAGDTYYIADDHAESASTVTITPKGTTSAPDRYLCVRRSGGSVPPVSADLRTTATVTSTTTTNIVLTSGYAYFYGLKLIAGGSINTSNDITTGKHYRFEACALKIGNSGSGSPRLNIGGHGGSGDPASDGYELVNTTFETGVSGGIICMQTGWLLWRDTASAIAGATLPTTLFGNSSTSARSYVNIVLDGVDLSALGSGKTLVGALGNSGAARLANCKLGSSVTVASTPTASAGFVVDVLNADSGATGYRQERYAYEATLTSETTIVRTGGASDGTQSLSHKIVTTANASWIQPFESFEMAQWIDSTGSSKTLTVETITDGVTLKNNECWIEAQVLDSSGTPLAALYTSGTDILASGSNNATSSESWTTTGLSSPTKQYMSVTFTDQIKGYVRVIVKVAKASTTLYVCPKMTVA